MGSLSARHWMITALFALVVAMLALTPSAEAATCDYPGAGRCIATVLSEAPQDHGDPVNEDGQALCAHGHCHHSGVTLPSTLQPLGVSATLKTSLVRPSADPLASCAPGGLERPPRA